MKNSTWILFLAILIVSACTRPSTAAVTPTPSLTPASLPLPQQPSATPGTGIGRTQKRELDGMLVVFVPSGAFVMGNNNGAPEEKPVHIVTLDAFWMDQNEVTNGMYAKCVLAGVCQPPSTARSYKWASYYGNSQFTDYPVIYVDWNKARTYCGWVGARLPSEAEWEKAARGTDGRKYPWGETIDKSYANYGNFPDGDTSPVGSYKKGASLYGAYDLAGNVKEWVADWYSDTYYHDSPSSNPAGPASGTLRVLRGGGWLNDDRSVQSDKRNAEPPTNVYNDIGFRCAASAAPANAPTGTPVASPPAAATTTVTVQASATPLSTATATPLSTATATPFAAATATTVPAPTATTVLAPTATTAIQPTATRSATSTAVMTSPAYQIGSTRTRENDGMVMVYVPAGPFRMGNDSGGDEAPQHTVTLDAFWIDQTEVTNRMYALCVQAGNCTKPAASSSYERSNYFGSRQFADYPVIYVNWNQAQTYCEWSGARLPTEAEWEKAARGTDGRTYPWGEKINNSFGNFNYNNGDTIAVGSYEKGASPYGAFDMTGNVWEWVNDWYAAYPGGSLSASPNFGTAARVLRGGSWADAISDLRVTYRSAGIPSTTFNTLGFRCAHAQ